MVAFPALEEALVRSDQTSVAGAINSTGGSIEPDMVDGSMMTSALAALFACYYVSSFHYIAANQLQKAAPADDDADTLTFGFAADETAEKHVADDRDTADPTEGTVGGGDDEGGEPDDDTATSTPKKAMTPKIVALRLVVGFLFIFVVVVVGKLNSTVGGVLAVFPALGTANQLLLWHSAGPKVVKDLSIALTIGNTGVFAYTFIFGFAIERLGKDGAGPWVALAIAFVGSLSIFNIPLWLALQK